MTSSDMPTLADAATQFFRTAFGAEPEGVWAAPGRVNLIGEHVDYAGGVSIPFALEQCTAVAVSPRADGRLRMVSRAVHQGAPCAGEQHAVEPRGYEPVEVALDAVAPGNPQGWAGYVAGSVWAAKEAGVLDCRGLDIAVVSEVPVGAGLSSSAALECAVAVAAFELWHGRTPGDAERTQLVRTCMRAENEIVGASTGGLDQNASLFGQRGKALVLDFASGEVRRVPFDIAKQGMVLLIADTNAPHTLSDGQYASRRGVIDEVQGEGSIRTMADPLAGLEGIPRNRVRHVVEETQRALDAAAALESGEWEEFRSLMRESHISLRDLYEVTTPELDSAFEAAGEHGARMTGGGFGGAVIALLKEEDVPEVSRRIREAAARRGFPEPTLLLASPGEGARRLR